VPIDNTMSYIFENDIPPGETAEVKIHAVGLQEGDYSGNIDICINSDTSFLERPVRTIIE
ncbi:MAG: hypothetical protein OEZ34_12570, partial [Spirochaetia bacterium]|nr:hypothetical protein [Spirochaetia bacterium]